MKLRLTLVLVFMMCVPVLVHAEDANAHRPFEIGWNVLSYSRQGSVDLYGGDLSFTAYPSQKIGIVADVAIHSGTVNSLDLTSTTYRFGPKFVFKHGSRVRSFGEVLVGGTHLNGSASITAGGTTTTQSESISGFAMAVGGGLDVGIRPWIAIRVAQVDYSYLHISGGSSNGVRIGGGLVFRFGSH
jgi:opacity protein-like surface antigen